MAPRWTCKACKWLLMNNLVLQQAKRENLFVNESDLVRRSPSAQMSLTVVVAPFTLGSMTAPAEGAHFASRHFLTGEPRRDQERDRQNHFRRDWPDSAQDQGNRPEDVRRDRGNPGRGAAHRTAEFRRVRSQKASRAQGAQPPHRRQGLCA